MNLGCTNSMSKKKWWLLIEARSLISTRLIGISVWNVEKFIWVGRIFDTCQIHKCIILVSWAKVARKYYVSCVCMASYALVHTLLTLTKPCTYTYTYYFKCSQQNFFGQLSLGIPWLQFERNLEHSYWGNGC